MKSLWIRFTQAFQALPQGLIAGRIRSRLLAALLAIALIPLLALGGMSYKLATQALLDKATEHLEGVRQLKGMAVQAFFDDRREDLENMADATAHLYAAGADHIAAAVKAGSRADAGQVLVETVSPRIEGQAHDLLRQFRDRAGFENIYLINADGYVFHAVNHGPDRYTNLLTGPFKETSLGRLTARVLQTKSFGLVDFENYMPAQHAPSAFMALPVMTGDQVRFILAARLSVQQINNVAGERTGLGRSGDTYFVGSDRLLRNDAARMKTQQVQSTILNPDYTVDTRASRSAHKGDSDTRVIENYAGVRVLSSWQPLTIAEPNPVNPEGIRWALITEVDEAEIQEPLQTFALVLAGALGVAVLLVFAGGYWLSGGLVRQIRHIMDLFSEIGIGNFHARCRVVSRDELGTMAASLNAMLDNTLNLMQSSEERDKMQGAIMTLLTDISALTEGDLTVRAEVTEDMTGAIADSFNTMAEQLSLLVSNVKRSTLEVSTTSSEVSQTTIELSRTSDEHANRMTEAVKSIEEMTASIQRVSKHASKSAQVSEQAMQNALDGADAVRQTNQAMSAIRERVQEAARAIKRLGESSQEIGNIVQIINDIADRTSILALNASIQAAMAGDAGRGFAVVADEVQRLAEQSTNSTKQIETLVKTIQGEINEAGTRMEESIQRVVHGSKLADNAHGRLQEIETVSAELADLVSAISQAALEQAISSQQITETMKQVGQISSKASLQGRRTAVSITNLAKTSEQLRASVEAFKLAEEEELHEIDDDLETLHEVA